ncbi:MAG: hypothetical protein JW913_17185 [Chitinispirillaceae bacterium]|nr:hypothetical protein [Chitinispirillaceae bacterium]
MRTSSIKSSLFFSLLLFAAPACNGEKKRNTAPASPKKIFFTQPWNKTFHLRETETGEILSIGAVFGTAANVFVYDQAQGAVVTLDTSGKVVTTVQLSSIGRNSYAGDDFVMEDSVFVFLNGVDRRLEFFNRITGMHLRSVPIPADLLSGVQKRSQRIVNRLFLDDGRLMIGNEYRLVAFDGRLGKRIATAAAVSAAENERFVLYRKHRPVVMRDSLLFLRSIGATYRLPPTHYSITGKRFFTLGSRLFSIDAGKDSIRIAEVR